MNRDDFELSLKIDLRDQDQRLSKKNLNIYMQKFYIQLILLFLYRKIYSYNEYKRY